MRLAGNIPPVSLTAFNAQTSSQVEVGKEKTMEHPHLIEKKRLEAIHPGNATSEEVDEAKLRLFVLNKIIGLATEIQQKNSALCYMTACDLIDEVLQS